MTERTVEQICRDLLHKAVQGHVVEPWLPIDSLTAADLAGMANELSKILNPLRRDAERWRKLLEETLRSKPRIRVGMGGVWISGGYLEQQVDGLAD